MRSLANEMRPATFGSAIGEAARINGGNLRKQIVDGRTAHAYFFSGLRGSGKTTTARTLAKALNCLDLKGGEPCGCCPNCKKIEEGSTTDVKEVDCARNNGVDYAKQLEEDASYRPIELKKKVYILDECHCMTGDAFSSLLKLVETPPEWCVFIFATTDPQKVPVTIRSRCQNYTFKAVSKAEMSEHLMKIAKEYGVSLSKAAADTISRHSEGSVRDAVMALETCMGEKCGEITEEDVNVILGCESWQQIFMLLDALDSGNRRFITMCIDRWFNEGRKITDVIADCMTVVTDRLRFLAGVEPTGTEDYINYIKDNKITESKAFGIADGLRETYEKMRYSPDRGILTVSLLKVAAKKEDVSYVNEEAMLQRLSAAEKTIEILSKKLKEIESGAIAIKVNAEATASAETARPAQGVQEQAAVQPVTTVTLPDLDDFFEGFYGNDADNVIQTEETSSCEMPAEETVVKEAYDIAEQEPVYEVETVEEYVPEVETAYGQNDGTEEYAYDEAELPSEFVEDSYYNAVETEDVPDGFDVYDGPLPFDDEVSVPESFDETTVAYEDYENGVPAEAENVSEDIPSEESVNSSAGELMGFDDFESVFEYATSHADDDTKNMWKVTEKAQEDAKFGKGLELCDQETVNGKIVFRVTKAKSEKDAKAVAKWLQNKLHEFGFDEFTEVVA